jgi:hypothetical protein
MYHYLKTISAHSKGPGKIDAPMMILGLGDEVLKIWAGARRVNG